MVSSAKLEPMLADELVAEALGPEPPTAVQVQDQSYILREDPAPWGTMWSGAAGFQPSDAGLAIALPPLAERRVGDAAAAADDAGVADRLVEPDPAQPGACIHPVSSLPGAALTVMGSGDSRAGRMGRGATRSSNPTPENPRFGLGALI